MIKRKSKKCRCEVQRRLNLDSANLFSRDLFRSTTRSDVLLELARRILGLKYNVAVQTIIEIKTISKLPSYTYPLSHVWRSNLCTYLYNEHRLTNRTVFKSELWWLMNFIVKVYWIRQRCMDIILQCLKSQNRKVLICFEL